MRILFLTQIIPYPPDAGPKVKTWHVLRFLKAQGHEVILVSFVRQEELQHVAALKQICSQIHTVPIQRSNFSDLRFWLRSLLSRRPFLVERDDLAAMRQTVDQILRRQPIDAIHADQLTMAQFAMNGENSTQRSAVHSEAAGSRSIVRIFDAHNAVWTILNRIRETAPWYLGPFLKLEARRVKQFEGEIVQTFDHTLAVTDIDRRYLLEAVDYAQNHYQAGNGANSADPLARIKVIPIAVDTDQLPPVQRSPNSLNILTLGTMHYPPNADGIRWFAQQVFPQIRSRIPQATLTIVGKNPPPDLTRLAEADPDHLEITGYVPDLVPHLERAALMVVPVRAGGGMRVRILEAFSRGMPVVTTSVGLEGIEARPGLDVIVEDTPEAFARAVVRLLNDPDQQALLSRNGRQLAERAYDWQSVLTRLEPIYSDARSERS